MIWNRILMFINICLKDANRGCQASSLRSPMPLTLISSYKHSNNEKSNAALQKYLRKFDFFKIFKTSPLHSSKQDYLLQRTVFIGESKLTWFHLFVKLSLVFCQNLNKLTLVQVLLTLLWLKKTSTGGWTVVRLGMLVLSKILELLWKDSSETRSSSSKGQSI